MQKRIAQSCSLVAALIMIGPWSSYGAVCYVDDPNHLQPRAATIQTGVGQELPALCNHTVEGTGCTLEVFNDGSVSSGSCLTVAGGVTVEMNDHTIDCTGSCDYAFNLTGSNVDLENGNITGCWLAAVGVGTSANSTITDFDIDLTATAGGCTGNGNNGISPNTGANYSLKTITRVAMRDGDGAGIISAYFTDVVDSIIRDFGTYGIIVTATSNSVGTDIIHSVLFGNGWNVATGTSYTGASISESFVSDGDTCNFANYGGSCAAPGTMMHLSGVNFDGNTILH